jgi:hypothetical protein
LRLARAVPRLLGDLLGHLRVDRIDAVCEFGFDDPCDTGVVFGLLSPLAHIVPSVSPAHVELRPVFEVACLSGDIDATVRVTPVRLIPPAVRFAWRALGPGRA